MLLLFLLAEMRPARAQDISPVIRGRELQIVDAEGRLRASITVSPKGSATYPENVVFRLHDRNGKPVVKLETHEAGAGISKGSGLGLLGGSDNTQGFIGTDGSSSKVELRNGNGSRQRVQP